MTDAEPPDDAELLSRPHEVVYRAEPVWADQVRRRLTKLGFTPFYLERPSSAGLARGVWTYRLSVAVPMEQADAARRALAAWEREATERLAPIGRSLGLQLALVFGSPLLFLLGWRYVAGLSWTRESFWIALGIAVALVAWFAIRQREVLATEIRPPDEDDPDRSD